MSRNLLAIPLLSLLALHAAAGRDPAPAACALHFAADGSVAIRVAGMPTQVIRPEVTVLWCDEDPRIYRYATTLNLYPAPPDAAIAIDSAGLAPVHPPRSKRCWPRDSRRSRWRNCRKRSGKSSWTSR